MELVQFMAHSLIVLKGKFEFAFETFVLVVREVMAVVMVVVVVLVGVKVHAREVRLAVILVVVVVVVVLVFRFVVFAVVKVEPGSRVSVRAFRLARGGRRRWGVDPDILAAVLAAVFYVAVVLGCCVREGSLLVMLLTIFPKSRRGLPATIVVTDDIFLLVAAMAVVVVSVDSGSRSGGCG